MDCCDPKQFRSTQPKFSCESGSFDRARCLIAATVLHLQNQQQYLKDRSNKHRSPSRFLWKCFSSWPFCSEAVEIMYLLGACLCAFWSWKTDPIQLAKSHQELPVRFTQSVWVCSWRQELCVKNLEGWIFFPAGWEIFSEGIVYLGRFAGRCWCELENQSQISAFGKMLDFNLKVALRTCM